MSAQTDTDDHSRQDGTSGVPFDPADFARPPAKDCPPEEEDDDSSTDSLSGDEESFTDRPRWVRHVKTHWREILAWSFAALLLVRIGVAFYFAEFWIGYLPQFGLLALLTAELFFSKDLCLSLVSCILLVDSLIADGYHLFTYRAVYHHRLDLNWPYDDRFQIILVTLGLIIIVWRERSVPRLVTAIPLLGIFLVLFAILIANL